MAELVYEDPWGEVIDRPSQDLVELRWFDTTEAITKQAFQGWLTKFAGCVERCGRRKVLVDNTSFRMRLDQMDGPWRDANIIPRYNAAGVTKFAFQMPQGMPMIGSAPAPEPPGRFPTGYFGSRQTALDWLSA